MKFRIFALTCLSLSVTACAVSDLSPERAKLVNEYEIEKSNANKFYSELSERKGKIENSPTLLPISNLDDKGLVDQTGILKKYITRSTSEISQLNSISNERYKGKYVGDLIEISFKNGSLLVDDFNYLLRPVIFQISRGDSRVITIKDSEYLNSGKKQDIRVTYAENYMLYVNGDNLGLIPKKTSRTFEYFSNINNRSISGNITSSPSL